MNRVAVVINEFGEVGIDHELVAASSENVTLLANGCLCCTVRTDLQETLRELFADRRAGSIVDFDRVVIETTGLADPAPVIQTFATDALLAAQYRLDGLVTLVDAVNGAATLDAHGEAVKQAAIADRLLLTKTDIAGAAEVAGLRNRLGALNPGAATAEAVMGEIDPAFFLDIGLRTSRADTPQLERWLGIGTAGGERYLGNRLAPGTHDRTIRSFVLRFDRPFSWQAFSSAMELLTSMRGPDLLRVKGFVNVEGEPGPVVVQGVQHVFHPPVALAAWPGEDRRSRLVFITRNLPQEAIEALFGAVAGLRTRPGAG
jgi:G3E family GTPase